MKPSVTGQRRKSKAPRTPAAKGGSKARIAEVAKLEITNATELAQERRIPGQWQWLSFVNRTGFLGAAIVWAHGMETAVLRARELNISGGFRGEVEVFCEPISRRIMEEHVPADLRNRLLSEAEVLTRLEGKPA